MKVLRDGKEVKDATVIYTAFGTPDTVRIDGTHYAASAFTFEEPKEVVKTKDGEEKQAAKPAKKTVKKSK